MLNISEINTENTFDLNQTKAFLKAIKNHRYESHFKLMMTYQLSRMELVNLEWSDINFDNDTITIYPVSWHRTNSIYYRWITVKKEKLSRTFPLLPNIKELLLKEKFKQEMNKEYSGNYDFSNSKYVCVKQDGTRLNYNTLSRNLRYVARDNGLPQILLDGLKKSLDSFIMSKSNDYEYYRAWTRFDCVQKKTNLEYKNINLQKNKRFLNSLNNLLEISSEQQRKKSDMEM